METGYWYIAGWVAVLVLMFVVPLLVVFTVYLARVNYKLAGIKRTLALSFPAETEKSEDDDSRDSYLEKLFVRRRNRNAIDNNFIDSEHNDANEESRTIFTHKTSIP